MSAHEYRYDVAISFARDQRDYAREVQHELFIKGIRCFFDEIQQVQLWGQDLVERFDEVFRKDAQFCVACVSSEWVERVWPAHERRSALARAIQEPGYILPVRFDDSEVPGLSPTIAYLDGNEIDPENLANMIAVKLASRHRPNYLPPLPNRLFASLEIPAGDEEEEEKVLSRAVAFLSDLEELTEDERKLVITVLRFGCPCTLPENAHILLDRLRRVTGWDDDRVQELLGSLRKVPGFAASLERGNGSGEFKVQIGWEPMGVGDPQGAATDVADAMIAEARFGTCDGCYQAALDRLDFSRTSSLLDWSSDESSQFDAEDSPPAIRGLVQDLLDEGWQMEVTASQLRFLGPGETNFETVPLWDRHDRECLGIAREILEDLVMKERGLPAASGEA
jgi:hypothetical protein